MGDFTQSEADKLKASSPLAWIMLSGIQTENQLPVEFKQHRFLIDLYGDLHDDIVVKKSAQVGESVERILKAFWCAKYLRANVIYVLPTNNVVRDFVTPKVNPIITSNPSINALVQRDSESIKQVGDRFIYFKGAFSERDAISISGDILILDELDRMPDMNVVNTYDSRLQASKLGYRWRLSNPSGIGYGVDALYADSDQRHWFVTCPACQHKMYLDLEPSDDKNHYIDVESKQYHCGNPECEGVLSDDDRRGGYWVAKYPGRRRHGYWISQLMAPWVSAARILEQKEESGIEFFYNFVLGKAYTPSDLVVNRETILRACAPSVIPKVNVVMGVDQSASGQYYVAGTPAGIFAHGKTKSWEDIERLKLQWNATVVCDPAPYPIMPKLLADKYQDFYLARFKLFNDAMTTIQWKGKNVSADRTRVFDIVAKEITEGKLLFREHPYALEDYIADWKNIYRTTEEKPDGRTRSVWVKVENKESDLSLATIYFRIGLAKILTGGSLGGFAEPKAYGQKNITDYVDEQGQLVTDLGDKVSQALNGTAHQVPEDEDAWLYQ